MDFEVRPNTKRTHRMLFGQILCVVMIAVILWILNWDIMAEYWQREPGAYWFFVGFIVIFALFFLLFCYAKRRPLIRVNRQTVTVYRLFRPAKEVAWSEITARKAEADRSYRNMGAVTASMAGGVIGYTIYKKARGIDADAPLTDYPRRYTYYQGDRKLIAILSREMENADRFDQMVADYLEGKSINAAGDMRAAMNEAPPAGKSKMPLAYAKAVGVVCILAIVAIAVVLRIQNPPAPTTQEPAEAEPVIYTCQDVTFEIDPAWTAVEGYDGAFVDGTGMVIYQLNGVSQLYPYTPEDFYFELLDFYEQGHNAVIGGQLEPSAGADGVERYMANMRMVEDNTYFQYLTLVIFPEQDAVITFGAQTTANGAALYEEEIIQTVEDMALSAAYVGKTGSILSFDLDETYFAGTSWIANNDGSQWLFAEDGDFHWYQTKGVTDDNYYAGTYKVYVGENAKDYLIEDLSDFGVTEEELMGTINARPEYGLDHFICITTTMESFMLDGQEQLTEPRVTHYFGFLLQDGTYLDIANMSTGSYYGFTKEK